MKSGIYQIRNIINGKRYIGSAVNIERRFKEHLKGLKNNNHYNRYLQRAWNKYEEDNFRFEILIYCNEEDLIDKEQKRINHYKSAQKKGYNLSPTAGSTLGVKCSKVTRERISIANKGKVRSDEFAKNCSLRQKGHFGWNKDRIVSQETRLKLSKAGKGRIVSQRTRRKLSEVLKGRKIGPLSEQTKKKISEANKGRIAWNKGLKTDISGMKGKKHSEETKKRMSESAKNRVTVKELL